MLSKSATAAQTSASVEEATEEISSALVIAVDVEDEE